MARQHRRHGFTVVELMVVTAIIGILVSLLLPAIQAAREAARRTQCANNLRQIGLALQHYHDVRKSFPAGMSWPNRLFWSGQILPFLEQGNLYNAIDLNAAWDVAPNSTVLTNYLSVYRCPSSTTPENLLAAGISNRVPSDYNACTSGLLNRESGPDPLVGRDYADGMFFVNSGLAIRDALDGTSSTIAIGEMLFRYEPSGADNYGLQQFLDHWYIGTPEGLGNEISESMSSTACPINAWRDTSLFVDERELAYSSHHPGGVQVAFIDGHVEFVEETINRTIWSAMGTRANGEIVAH